MTPERFEEILSLGENIKIEFKRCGDGIKHDTYETVCAFLNRFGGDIFLGVDDNGNILGVPEKAVDDWKKNFINHISNSNAFSPTTYIEPKDFKAVENQYVNQYVNQHINPKNQYVNEENQHVNEENPHVNGENQYVNEENPHVNGVNPPINSGNLPINSENPPLNEENPPLNENNPPLNLDEVDKGIIRAFNKDSKATYYSIAQHLGKNRDTIRAHIKKLAEARVISRIGARKNGYWQVNISLDQINLQ